MSDMASTPKRPSLAEQAEQIRRERAGGVPQGRAVPEQAWTAEQEYLSKAVAAHRADMVLEGAMMRFLRRGYRVTSRSAMSVQMVQPKKFSLFWALVWLFTCSGLIVYVVYYLAKRDCAVYLRVTPSGTIEEVRSGPLLSLSGWVCLGLTIPLALGALLLILQVLFGVRQ
jgi:hypothetical protein